MRFDFSQALVVAVTLCAASLVHTSEVPGIVSGSSYKLTAQCSNLCLDVSGASAATGANVQQWTDNGTNAQVWRLDYMPDGYYKLTAACSQKVLEVVGGSTIDGGDVVQGDDLGTDNQRWSIMPTGSGWHKLVAKSSQKCLDVNWASVYSGANVQQWSDNGTAAQRWGFTLVAPSQISGAYLTPGEYVLGPKHGSLVLGISGGSHSDGAQATQSTESGLPHQRWIIAGAGNGFFTLKAKHSQKLLDIAGVSQNDGATAIQWPDNSSDNQRWSIAQAQGDWQVITAKHSGKALAIDGSGSAVEAVAKQQANQSTDNQKWKFRASYSFTMSSTLVEATVAAGDYVAVNSQVTGTVTAYEACGSATVSPFSCTNGAAFNLPTNTPGFFRYVARNAQGDELGEVRLTVVRTNLPDQVIVDQYGYMRNVPILVEPAGAAVTFASTNIGLLTVGVPTTNNATVSQPITAVAPGSVYLVAQIAGPWGPTTIGRSRIIGFSSSTTAATGLTIVSEFPDGSLLTSATLTMTPKIADLDVTLRTFVSGVTFGDSTTVQDVSTNVFTANGASGQYVYYLLRAPSATSNYCHSITFYQNGIQVSR